MKEPEMASRAPRIFCAPGRVNLIGEHTDYNEGFVLPVALDMECEVRATRRRDRKLRARALDLGPVEAAWNLPQLARSQPRRDWSDYVAGVAVELARKGVAIPPLDLEITSSVPIGAGLSSSAALEVAVALALTSWEGDSLGGEELAVACRRAETEFVGLQCGIMDQFVAVFGRRGHALLLDCRSLEWRQVAIPPEVEIIVVDSGVKHELATSAYNLRRSECELAAAGLGRSLREITVEQWPRMEGRLEEPLRGRARGPGTSCTRISVCWISSRRPSAATSNAWAASWRSRMRALPPTTP
jgi:galactokinase